MWTHRSYPPRAPLGHYWGRIWRPAGRLTRAGVAPSILPCLRKRRATPAFGGIAARIDSGFDWPAQIDELLIRGFWERDRRRCRIGFRSDGVDHEQVNRTLDLSKCELEIGVEADLGRLGRWIDGVDVERSAEVGSEERILRRPKCRHRRRTSWDALVERQAGDRC